MKISGRASVVHVVSMGNTIVDVTSSFIPTDSKCPKKIEKVFVLLVFKFIPFSEVPGKHSVRCLCWATVAVFGGKVDGN